MSNAGFIFYQAIKSDSFNGNKSKVLYRLEQRIKNNFWWQMARLNLSLFGKTPQTNLSMKEITDKIPGIMMQLGELVERHDSLTNPVQRVNVEIQIMEKFFILQDFLGKFCTAFLRRAGQKLSDAEIRTLFLVYSTAKEPLRGPLAALGNIRKKVSQICDNFRDEAGDEMEKYYGLRRYSVEMKKGVQSDVNARLASIQKKVQQQIGLKDLRTADDVIKLRAVQPPKEQEQAIRQRLQIYNAMQGSKNKQETAARK